MARSPSTREEAMGDGDYHAARCAIESRASRSHTTHSSPCDVGDEDDLLRMLARPVKSPKVVDNSMAIGDYYRSVETPRAASRDVGAGESIRPFHVQVESVHGRQQAIEIMSHVTGGYDSQRRRRLCSANGSSKKTPSSSAKTVLIQSLIIILPPALVLVLLKYSVTYAMLCVLNVVVALASWEWSWWSFRIRQRLLVSLQSLHTLQPQPMTQQQQPPPTSREEMEERQDHALNQEQFALGEATTKCCRAFRYNKYLLASLVSLLLSAALVSIVMVFADSIVTDEHSTLGERVLFASVVTASTSAFFCGCLSPVPADAFIVFVYEACFVISSLNSFLAHHEHLVHDPELLDSMYVLLVGACAIVVWRIVSSKDVMESTIMAMLDILGLAYLVAPMMAMADFLGHPTVKLYGDVVGTFFVVVSAAEAAYHLNEAVKDAYPRLLSRCRYPLVKNVSKSLGVESMLLSIVFGFVGAVLSILCFNGYMISWEDALVYLGAIIMSQLCRLALDAMKTMAKVDGLSLVTFHPWVPGFMELLNPYLLAMIVFHPYVKALIKEQEG